MVLPPKQPPSNNGNPPNRPTPTSSNTQQQPQWGIDPINAEDETYPSDDDNGSNGGGHNNTSSTQNHDGKDDKYSSHPLAKLIPYDYIDDPHTATPQLENLSTLPTNSALPRLLAAADADIILHKARTHCALTNNPSVLINFDPSKDPSYVERLSRQEELRVNIASLESKKDAIISDLSAGPSKPGMTAGDIQREKLQRWQRAMELYVLSSTQDDIDLLSLLEKLCEGCSAEEELLSALSAAASACSLVVETTSLAVNDASRDAMEAEDAFRMRLEAHEIFARAMAAEGAEDIEDKFFGTGKSAMKIGRELELAEAKRRKCEDASKLIDLWWEIESYAMHEHASGEVLMVDEEIKEVIPLESCKIDPLYTNPDNSLAAAKALKNLRMVVKKRGITPTGMVVPASIERFELTGDLVHRISDALEGRLINHFASYYGKGDTYDFTEKNSGRAGRIDWLKLRELAQAARCFEDGRNLHKKYVQLVVTARFPELDEQDDEWEDIPEEGEDYQNGDGFDVDATRTKLNTLFHKVCEVCVSEFELISHVFSTPKTDGGEDKTIDQTPFRVARLLSQRIISDPRNGLQARIDELLETIDQKSDFDAGSKKLDTFVVIHEKAAGLFTLLKEAAEQNLIPKMEEEEATSQDVKDAHRRALAPLIQFLTQQEISLSNGQRRGYLNLELRLLHHECCSNFDNVDAKMISPLASSNTRKSKQEDAAAAAAAAAPTSIHYVAPLLPLDVSSLLKAGYPALLQGVLKASTLRQPLMHATDSLARARLMFGGDNTDDGGEGLSRVVFAIYAQMCRFYGQAYLFCVLEALEKMVNVSPGNAPPALPFDEDLPPHDLGVDGMFWVSMERVQSAAKSFDRETWAENRQQGSIGGAPRVWELLTDAAAAPTAGGNTSAALNNARNERLQLFKQLEETGERVILTALGTISRHIRWILVTGGESMLATGGNRLLSNFQNTLTQQQNTQLGPYAVPAGSVFEEPNSPAVQSLTYCLRAQFVQVQNSLTPPSLSSFWTALSKSIYDILIARLLQHYNVSTYGAVILSRDVEALRSVAMLAGDDHAHWDILRELLTLYMTGPEALKAILVGPEEAGTKGLFARAGVEQSLVFMSRRCDYRVKTNQGMKKSQWAVELLNELGKRDPTDGNISMSRFSAQRNTNHY